MAGVDFVLAGASMYIAYFTVAALGYASAMSPGTDLLVQAASFGVAVSVSMAAMGLYSVKQRYRLDGVIARIFVGIGMAVVGIAVLEFVFRFVGSRPVWLLALAISAIALCIARVAFQKLIDDDVFRRRVLVYGAGKRASKILQLRRRSDQRGFRVVAFVPTASDELAIQDPRVLAFGGSPMLDFVRAHRIDEIVIAVDDRRRSFPISELLSCKLAGVGVIDLLEFLERETGRIKVDMLNPAWLIFSKGFAGTGRDHLSFRCLDLIMAMALSLLALPVGLLVALAIYLDDGGPVIYSQRRVGFDGRPFVLHKFRSMKNNAEAAGAQWATREDDRVTRVGRWIRKTRLDELPQLINILKGNMSFVGPRPERPEFVDELSRKIPYYHERHCVKPGLTGWAQLCYPYGASEEDAKAKLEYDMYYVKNRSLIFNLMILLQTVEVVLWQKGSR